MNLESLVEKVVTLSDERGYWFIRTDSGLNFDNFYNGNFVGVGWNEISTTELDNASFFGEEIKTKIAKLYGYDMTLARSKSKVTSIYNKLVNFRNLKQGDLVIIPSVGSARLAFGIIMDSKIYEDKSVNDKCDYSKRRMVKWVENKPVHLLDSIYYQIIQSRHAICNIKKYEAHIDIVTENLYIKNNYTHYVLDIKTDEDINLNSLLTLFSLVNELTDKINKELGLHEETDKISVKLNLQSPGKITFKGVGKALILLASIFASCSDSDDNRLKLSPSPDKGKELIDIDTTKKEEAMRIIRTLKMEFKKPVR
jgi:restriction system protein